MDDETRNELIAIVWRAIDQGADTSDILDQIQQAFSSYSD